MPILYGLPLGHGATLATLPLGVEATLDADARTLTIDQPAVVGACRKPSNRRRRLDRSTLETPAE